MAAPTFSLPVVQSGSGYATTRLNLETAVQTVVNTLDARIEPLENLAEGGNITAATWTELSALTGVREGQRADVLTDAGSHTDPVVGGTVANEGIYAWSVSPAGWRRVGDPSDATVVAEVTGARGGAASLPDRLGEMDDATAEARDLAGLVAGGPVETIGRAEPPALGPSFSAGSTFVFATPATRTGNLTRVRVYAAGGTTSLKVRVLRLSGGTLTQVGTDAVITASAGLHEYSVADGDFSPLPIEAGDYIGWYMPTGGVRYSGAVLPSADAYWVTAGDTTTFSPGALITAALWSIGFDIEATDFLTRATIERADRVARSTSVETTGWIGRPETPADGVAGSNATYTFAEPMPGEGEITGLNVWSKGAGDILIFTFDEIGGQLVASGPPTRVVLASGLNELSAPADMPAIPVRQGQLVGFNMGARVAALTVPGDSGGYYPSPTGVRANYTPTAHITGTRLQIGFRIEYLRDTALKFEQLSQIEYLTAVKRADTLYVVEMGLSAPKLYLGRIALTQPGPAVTIKGVTIGDSTIAERLGRPAVSTLIADYDATDISDGGDTIAQQLALWNAIPDYSAFEVVVAQIGLNDVNETGDASSAISQLQGLIDQIRLDVPPSCKVYVAKMLPCKSRWDVLWPGNDGSPQQQWEDINEAIAGEGPTPITGVDGRIVDHVPLLDDGAGNLHPSYDTGDGIHENTAGAQIIADVWRMKWVADGLLV